MELTIYFDIAAVLLCTLMLVALYIRGLVKGRTNMLFLALTGLIIAAGIMDISTNLYGPVWPENIYTVTAQKIQNYIYFFIRNLTTPMFIVYISSLLGQWHKFNDTKWYRPMLILPYCIDVVFLIVNMWKPVVFGFNGYGQYYRGEYIWVLYLVAFYYMVFGTVIIIRCRSVLTNSKKAVIIAFIPITAAAILIQVSSPVWRIEILSTAIMTFLVAIVVQRPEENLDKVVNTQSYSAFLLNVKAMFELKRPVAIIFFKVKNHTNIRNSIGLEKFTELLKIIADKLNRASYIMQTGGEVYYLDRAAFAVITDIDRKDNLEDFARLLNAYMLEPVKVDELEIQVESRIVLATVPYDITSEEKLINFASSFHTTFNENNKVLTLSKYIESKDFNIRNNIDSIISKAITERNFKMYYQPIYSIKDKKFVSAEALIRLIDDEYGFISPGIFIPAAEKSGAIHKIGDFVLEDVCRFISESEITKYGVKYVEINLSVAQCVEPNLINKVESTIKKYKVFKGSINLEITETAMDSDQEMTDQNINGLSERGYKFSLDDYGTGYSNIMRLTKLPVGIVKLDKSFVDEMDRPEMYTVIEHTIKMLKKMDKEILVEGVEEKDKLDKFIELGCDYIQGFYFSKPLPEKDFIAFIEKENNK